MSYLIYSREFSVADVLFLSWTCYRFRVILECHLNPTTTITRITKTPQQAKTIKRVAALSYKDLKIKKSREDGKELF